MLGIRFKVLGVVFLVTLSAFGPELENSFHGMIHDEKERASQQTHSVTGSHSLGDGTGLHYSPLPELQLGNEDARSNPGTRRRHDAEDLGRD